MIGQLGISSRSTVVDLGAGTGKFTRMLLPGGARLIAIEPVAAMREAFQRAVPNVSVIDATAEELPLADGSMDAVVAAQAFHWFATSAALAEIHRVLRPDGGLGLIWNRRDLGDPLQAALDQIVAGYRGEAPSHERDSWRDVVSSSGAFRLMSEQRYPMEQVVDAEGVVDRVLSISFMASLEDAERAAIAEKILALLPARAGHVLRYRTDVFIYRRA
jgi:ubiquinone/menaquinone biosynthesis C-methylase UbiE